MKKTLVSIFAVLVLSNAFGQDQQPTEADKLRTAVIEMAKVIADEKVQKDDQSKVQSDKLAALQMALDKSIQETKDANQRTLIIGAAALPVSLFIGCASAGKWQLGTVLLSASAGAEFATWGLLELSKIVPAETHPKTGS
jgi:hypothetical protein